jgi:chemotaxis protein methyltransferase CheR
MSRIEHPVNVEERVMKPAEFNRIRKMAYDFCGVDLGGREVLVETRLSKKLRELNLPSFQLYCDYVQEDASGDAFTAMIDALTTNHTSFFREKKHFEFLCQSVLPAIHPRDPIRIWSAACSTGEEPYTIAFAVLTACKQGYDRLTISATDISTRVLKRAAQGVYPAASLGGLSQDSLHSFFLKGSGSYAGQCLVRKEVRRLVEFRQLNLLEDCSDVGPFDVIFCRNVMIYFDQQTQQSVVDHLAARLVPGGYLFIGHAESLNNIKHGLKYISSAIYQKTGPSQGERPSYRLSAVKKGRS